MYISPILYTVSSVRYSIVILSFESLWARIFFCVGKNKQQKAIAQILSDMDQEIETLKEKLEKYKTIKQGMMQELLTGRIRLI